jgi:hypothetical protein
MKMREKRVWDQMFGLKSGQLFPQRDAQIENAKKFEMPADFISADSPEHHICINLVKKIIYAHPTELNTSLSNMLATVASEKTFAKIKINIHGD